MPYTKQPTSGVVRRRGVTLLELLVVVTLMGVLSSVVMTRYGRDVFGDFGARSEAHQLWIDLEVTRRLSIRTGKAHTLVMTGPAAGPWVGYDVVEGGLSDARAGKGASQPGFPRQFPDELVVTGNRQAVDFSFEGHASGAGEWLLSGPHRSWSVRVVPLSGAASTSEVNR